MAFYGGSRPRGGSELGSSNTPATRMWHQGFGGRQMAVLFVQETTCRRVAALGESADVYRIRVWQRPDGLWAFAQAGTKT